MNLCSCSALLDSNQMDPKGIHMKKIFLKTEKERAYVFWSAKLWFDTNMKKATVLLRKHVLLFADILSGT